MIENNKNAYLIKKNRSSWKRLIKWTFGIISMFIILAGLFIHFDTSVAANLTDNVLRPILGSDNIMRLEQIYFNTTDKITQTFSVFKTEKSPLLDINKNKKNYHLNNVVSNLDLNPIFTNTKDPLDKEGQWQNIPLDLFPNESVMAETFIRPDAKRPYAFVTLVQMDMSKMNLFSVAGTVEPASKVGMPGPGVIPKEVQDSGKLVVAFDGGFQYMDGQYGMIVDGVTYLPLKKDLATIVGYKNGKIEIINYKGQDLGKDVLFVRQNCPILVEDGVVVANNVSNRKIWGRTTTWKIHTWRSGIGITAKGNLIFAIGNSLESDTLANALKSAGAVNAMQLDINPNWVRFNIFSNFSGGQYTSKPIIEGIKDGAQDFLKGDKKDFFYITKKTS